MTRYAIIVVAVALAACSSGGTTPTDTGNPSPSARTLTVRVGETAAVGNTGVTIAFLRVAEDSRCPLNAVCVWEGNGEVELTLSTGYLTRDVALNTTTEPRKTEFVGLEIALSALDPYPSGEPTDPGDYVATFQIDSD